MESAAQIEKALEQYTIENSNFETSRNYISLSHCGLSAQELAEQFKQGFHADTIGRLRCYKGYQMEQDLRRRLRECIHGISPSFEISQYRGLVKGHPDFCLDGCPGDCKSVLMDDWIPVGKLPRKVYFQMQGYMLYSNTPCALVVYESRQSGVIKVFEVSANLGTQQIIKRTIEQAIKLIDSNF